MANSDSTRDGGVAVLALFVNGDNSFSKRLSLDNTVDGIKHELCSKWSNLTPNSFDLSYDLGGLKRFIECDLDLHSILLLCNHKNADYFVVSLSLKKNLKQIVCNSNDSGAASSSSFVGENICLDVVDDDRSSLDYVKRVLRRQLPNPILQGVGQLFAGGVIEFRLNLILYSLVSGKKLKYLKNDPLRVTVKCAAENCPFRVYASKKFNLPNFFMIKTMNSNHSCGAGVLDLNNPPVKSKLIKELVMDGIRVNPHLKTKDVINLFRTEYNLVVKYYFAYTGKKLALEEIHGNDLTSYHHLVSFCDSVMASNPGSFVSLVKDKNTSQFDRVFIGFEACKYGFRFCRPLIFLDGTFMRGRTEGCLMSATGKNGNQGIFQLALGIVSGEDELNWVWFLNQLKDMLSGDDRPITFISDRHPAIRLA